MKGIGDLTAVLVSPATANAVFHATGRRARDGEPSRPDGIVAQFPDRERALACHNSPDYQAALADRALGLDRRFQLLG